MPDELVVGATGQGNLIIQSGGIVVSRTPGNSPAGSVGRGITGVGSATVTGAGSIWENLNGEIQIGQSGRGTLLISDGGLVRMSTIFGTRIGADALGVGEVTVTGSGSSMQMPGEMDVGFDGRGRLTIEAGATVNNGGGRIATSGIRSAMSW